jgi:hypothetical protein
MSNNNASAIVIQMGLRTHHQDHTITLVSLSTIKTMVNKPVNPMPLFVVVELLLIIVYFPQSIKSFFIMQIKTPAISDKGKIYNQLQT